MRVKIALHNIGSHVRNQNKRLRKGISIAGLDEEMP